ncbi:MAG: heme-copper oxidase subunit III [Chloroflexi bacterium]|nr:heme-copper oxidase subunit III [Chloroflexota bacterium]
MTATAGEARTGAVRAARPHRDGVATQSLGLWIFIASEAFLFLILIATRYLLIGRERPIEVEQLLGAAVTTVLLSSSATAYTGLRALRRGDEAAYRRWIRLTLALGVAFLVGLSLEWAEGFGAFPPGRGYGSVFFALTGVHGFHVASGLVVLALVLRSGRTTWPATAAVRYWTFVDAVWLFIYPTLYLV